MLKNYYARRSGRCAFFAEDNGTNAHHDVVFPSAAEAHAYHARALGADFLSKALHRGENCGLTGFDRHYRGLRVGDPVLTAAADRPSKERNETWDLLLASLAATFSNEVRADEPDVICKFERRTVLAFFPDASG
jgi:hypothetical protein